MGGNQNGWQAWGQGQLEAEAPGHKGPGLGASQEWVGFGVLQPLSGRLGLAWQGLGLGVVVVVGTWGGQKREDVAGQEELQQASLAYLASSLLKCQFIRQAFSGLP